MKKLGRVILLVSMTAVGGANASDWVHVENGVKSAIFVDADSIAPSGKYWKAWAQTIYENPQETKTYPTKYFKETKYLQYFNCVEKTSSITQWMAYGEEGNVVESEGSALSSKLFTESTPDTVGESVLNYVCKEVAKRKRKK